MSAEVKRLLRKQIREAIAALMPQERAAQESRLLGLLRDFLRQHPQAVTGKVLAYLPLPDEPDIRPALRDWEHAGKLCLPQMRADGSLLVREAPSGEGGIITGAFGVQEPDDRCPLVELASVSLVIVPGRAFTLTGDRLGRGKGYYDRLLADLAQSVRPNSRPPALTVALALPCQVVAALPVEAHDRRVQFLLA